MTSIVYDTPLWADARSRALERDGHRCTVSRLFGGDCSSGPLHVHHIIPVSEGGDPYDLDNLGTACARHHPMWERMRRIVVAMRTPQPQVPRCRHEHRSAEAREICERRMARQHVAA